MACEFVYFLHRSPQYLLHRLYRYLGTRVEQGRPLLDRQIPGIARLPGSGWARRRRRLFSPVSRRAPGQHHTGGHHRGYERSTFPHNLYDGPSRRTVPPT